MSDNPKRNLKPGDIVGIHLPEMDLGDIKFPQQVVCYGRIVKPITAAFFCNQTAEWKSTGLVDGYVVEGLKTKTSYSYSIREITLLSEVEQALAVLAAL